MGGDGEGEETLVAGVAWVGVGIPVGTAVPGPAGIDMVKLCPFQL